MIKPLEIGAAALGALLGAPLALANLRERQHPRELMPNGTYLNLQGYTIHYRDQGPKHGPVIVLIHGFAAWSFTWRQQIAALNRAGFRTIAIDQIGYGASDRPEAPVYSTYDHASLHLAALDQLGIDQFDVVGHSFGGRVALQVAVLAPQRVRRIAAICPEAFATQRPPIAFVAGMPIVGKALAFYSFMPNLIRPGLAMLSGSDQWLTPEAVQGYAAPLGVRGTAMSQVWQARSPKDGLKPVPNNLISIQQPTLLLWGQNDSVFPASDGTKLTQILPNAQLVVYPGVGHLPHEEVHEQVSTQLVQFFQE